MDVTGHKRPSAGAHQKGEDAHLDTQSFNEDMFAHPEIIGSHGSLGGAAKAAHGQTLQHVSPAPSHTVVKKPTHTRAHKDVKVGRSFLWLWLSFLSLVLVLGGLGIGYYVVASAADSEANAFARQLNVYVDDVYDATMTTTDSPADIVTLVDDITMPQLEEAFLGDTVSADYRQAREMGERVKNNVSLLKDELTRYGALYDFYTQYRTISSDIVDSSESASRASTETELSAVFTSIEQSFVALDTLVDEAVLPASLEEDQDELAAAHQTIVDAWADVIAARNANNSVAYAAAYARYEVAESDATSAFDAIEAFNGNLSLRVRAVSNDFKDASSN